MRDLEERKVDFEETWAIQYEAVVSRDEVGVVAAGAAYYKKYIKKET